MNPKDPRSAYRIQRIQDLLKTGNLDQWQLAEKLCMSRRNIREYVPYMLDQKLMHVVGWDQQFCAGPYLPTFRLGPGKNKPRPSAVPMLERKKLYRDRVQRDPLRHAKLLNARRLRWRLSKMRAKPATWLSALGVAP